MIFSISLSVAFSGMDGGSTGSLPSASASVPAIRKRFPSTYTVKLPPSACVTKPVVPSRRVTTSPAGIITALTSLVRDTGSLVWPNILLLRRYRLSNISQRRVESVPGESGALDARWILLHPFQCPKFSQVDLLDNILALRLVRPSRQAADHCRKKLERPFGIETDDRLR